MCVIEAPLPWVVHISGLKYVMTNNDGVVVATLTSSATIKVPPTTVGIVPNNTAPIGDFLPQSRLSCGFMLRVLSANPSTFSC